VPSGRRLGWANRQVLADLVPSGRRLGWANRQVLADLVPSGRRLGWGNRQVLADLVPSGRRLGWAKGNEGIEHPIHSSSPYHRRLIYRLSVHTRWFHA